MYLGRHPHCHFALSTVEQDPDPEEKVTAEALRLVSDVLTERVVIWSVAGLSMVIVVAITSMRSTP
jgi:hypothetical protein